MKLFTTTLLLALLSGLLPVKAQTTVLIKEVDPFNGTVTLENFGFNSQDVADWNLCSNFVYERIDSLTGSTTIQPQGTLTLTDLESITLDENGDELGLYTAVNSNADFGDDSFMEHYVQWNTTGSGRESVAVDAGLWTAGNQVPISNNGKLTYNGNPSPSGVSDWSAVTSRDERAQANDWSLFPVPAREELTFSLSGLNAGEAVNLQILNLQGQAVLTRELNGSEAQKLRLSVQDLPTGVYISRVQTEEGFWTRRFNVVD